MSTLKATNLQHASATSPNITLGSDGSVAVGGGNISPQTGFRNRIINGDMRIDQRNSGASINPTDGQFVVDRFAMGVSQTSKLTAQRSSVALAGFTNSILVTSSSAYTVLTADYFGISQNIEGFNVSDLGWGTANAQAVTLSFWVRSSLTGTFAGSLRNSASNRSYPFTYTISEANTFEQKTVTIAGDTSGTWLADNNTGIRVWFSLGAGATFSGTSGAWAGSNFVSATGATSLVGTNGAKFYITGVQLEKGTVATPFEFRSIGQELALCQRYAVAMNASNGGAGSGGTTSVQQRYVLPVTMRASPTLSTITAGSVNVSDDWAADYTAASATFSLQGANVNFVRASVGGFSGLTTGRVVGGNGNGTAVILFSAEL